MSGSKPTMTRAEVLKALKHPPEGGDFVWNGVDEDDRPASVAAMRAVIDAKRKVGRPPGSRKVSTTIRFDADVVEKFRARGRGWQSQMNAALREWLQAHE